MSEQTTLLEEKKSAKIKKSTKIVRRDRKPGEVFTRATAIRNFCLLCSGLNSAEVKRCKCRWCHLYPYRLGHLDSSIQDEKEKYEDEFQRAIDYSVGYD